MDLINFSFEKILDTIYDGVIVVDQDTTILYVNPAYTRILGIEKDKIVGQHLEELEPQAQLLEVLQSGEPIYNKRAHINSLNKDVIVNLTPIYKEDEIIGGVSIFKDISDLIQISRELKRVKELNKYLKRELEVNYKLPSAFDLLIGKSTKFIEVLKKAYKAAKTDVSILIRGENGTGKGMLAKAIHRSSYRRDSPFISINCAAIPENLLESELFGYKEGAFSGAKSEGKPGKFVQADGGTIFLDEIGDMSLPMQAKILKVIEEKEFIPVGGERRVKVDVRVVSATNKNLEEMVQENEFREDLYYRLNEVPLYLPPLRERKGDLFLLINYFLSDFANQEDLQFTEETKEILEHYHWPGNVRELKNVIKYAVVMAESYQITPLDLPSYLQNLTIKKQDSIPLDTWNMKELIRNYERDIIKKALEKTDNHRSQAIDLLGISRRTFYQKLKKYNLD